MMMVMVKGKTEWNGGRKENRQGECISLCRMYFHSSSSAEGAFEMCKVGEKLRKRETRRRSRRSLKMPRPNEIATKSCAAPKA